MATACKDNPHKQISAYCPYNSNYVICCGKEYSYDACVYPLVNKGRCGNKYKCECDSSQYKYTDRECKTVKGHAGEGYQNSYASGASCMQTGYDSKSGKITTEIKYSSCQCDRGIYPKDPKNCDKNSERNGPCSTKYSNSSATELYYKYCECNTQVYPKTDASCYPLKGDATNETCFDTIMRYKSCASCDEFPARSLDHVAYSGNPAKSSCRDPTEISEDAVFIMTKIERSVTAIGIHPTIHHGQTVTDAVCGNCNHPRPASVLNG